jgi:hypothetical protein
MAHHKKTPHQKTQMSGGIVGVIMSIAFAALAFVVAGLVLSYGTLINSNVASTLNSNASLGSIAPLAVANNVTSGLSTFGSNMPTIAQVTVAVLVIALLFLGFGGLISGKTGGGV